MKFKFIIASLLAAASFSAFAGNQTVEVISGGASKAFFSEGAGPLFSSEGGKDEITFSGLENGTYNFVLQLMGSNVNFNIGQSNLNGTTADIGINAGVFSFYGVTGTSHSPLTMNLYGSTLGTGTPSYTGTISVSAVPEPETYGMFLAGLGMLGFMARRKAAKKSV